MEKVGAAALGEVLQTVVSKELRADGKKWLQVVNMACATLSVIFLSITNSTELSSNIIFLNIIKAQQYLDTQPTLSAIFVWVFFAMTLKSVILAVMLFSARVVHDEHSQAWEKGRKGLRKYMAYWLIAYKVLLVPLVVLCFKLSSSKLLVIYRMTFILAMPIVYIFRLKLLYGNYFFLVVLMTWIVSASNFPICLLILSIMHLLNGESCMRNYLLLISVYQIIIFSNSFGHTDISPLHLTVITVTVLASALLLPSNPLLDKGAETILEAIDKLHKGETLCKQEKWELCRLGCHIAQQLKRQDIPSDSSKAAGIQSLQVSDTKEGLCGVLKSWLLLQKASNPSDLLLDIQLAEGQLFLRDFSVSSLAQIEAVSRSVEEKGGFQNRLRMMKLRHRLEQELMSKDEKLCRLRSVVQVEKYKESLRQKTGKLSNLYIAFWQSTSRTEEQLMKKLGQICATQQECLNLLETLRKHGQMHSQARVFNLFQSSFNNFSHEFAQERSSSSSEVKEDSGDTSYIMVSGSIITDISERLTSQIQAEKGFIVGCDVLNIIPVELQHYYRSHISQWLVSSHPVYLPLASSHDENVFFPSQCLFKILPQIEGGVRYLINVWSSTIRKGDACLLYSIANDRITKATPDFRREWLKGSGSFSPEEVLGIDLTFLSNYIRPLQATQPIVCELTLNATEKKSRARKVSRHTQHLLRLVEVYETRADHLCLLSIADKNEERTKRRTDATLVQLQLAQKGQMGQSDPNFCPIKNPHQELLDQRLNQHHAGVFRRTYLRTIMAIFLIGLLVGIGAFIQFQVVVDSSISTLSDQVASYTGHLGSKESIYVLFYQFYVYIHSIKRPKDFILTKSALSIPKLQAQFKSKTIKNLGSALTMALDPQISLTPTPYQLIYPDYVASGKTQPTTLVPLLEAIRSSFTTQDFTFVIRNANIIDTFIDSLLPIDTNTLHEAQQLEYFSFLTVTAALIACVLIIKCQYISIRMTIWNALQLYGKLSKEQVRKHLAILVRIKQAEKHPLNDEESDSLYSSRSNDLQLVEPVKTSTFLKALMSENLLLIVMVVLWSGFYYYCYSRLDAYRTETRMIINYAQRIQYISKIMTARSEFYYRVAMQELLPEEMRYQWPSRTTFELPSLFPNAVDLPPNFEDFARIQGNVLQQSLCGMPSVQTAVQKDLFMATLNCSQVLKNVLNDGFETAFPYYLHMLEKNTGTLLGGLSLAHDGKSYYPFFAEVIFCRKTFDVIISGVQSAFGGQISEFMDTKEEEFQRLIGLGVLLGLVAVGVTGAFLWRTRRLCRAGKKVFSVLPKSLIYNIRVSKHLLNSALLSDIERLTP